MNKKYVLSGTKVVKVMIAIGLIASLMNVLLYSDSDSAYLFFFLLLVNFVD